MQLTNKWNGEGGLVREEKLKPELNKKECRETWEQKCNLVDAIAYLGTHDSWGRVNTTKQWVIRGMGKGINTSISLLIRDPPSTL